MEDILEKMDEFTSEQLEHVPIKERYPLISPDERALSFGLGYWNGEAERRIKSGLVDDVLERKEFLVPMWKRSVVEGQDYAESLGDYDNFKREARRNSPFKPHEGLWGSKDLKVGGIELVDAFPTLKRGLESVSVWRNEGDVYGYDFSRESFDFDLEAFTHGIAEKQEKIAGEIFDTEDLPSNPLIVGVFDSRIMLGFPDLPTYDPSLDALLISKPHATMGIERFGVQIPTDTIIAHELGHRIARHLEAQKLGLSVSEVNERIGSLSNPRSFAWHTLHEGLAVVVQERDAGTDVTREMVAKVDFAPVEIHSALRDRNPLGFFRFADEIERVRYDESQDGQWETLTDDEANFLDRYLIGSFAEFVIEKYGIDEYIELIADSQWVSEDKCGVSDVVELHFGSTEVIGDWFTEKVLTSVGEEDSSQLIGIEPKAL